MHYKTYRKEIEVREIVRESSSRKMETKRITESERDDEREKERATKTKNQER
jgi:hypothetical protein